MRHILNMRFKTAVSGGLALSAPIVAGGFFVALFLGAAAERVYIVFLIGLITVIGMGIYSGNTGILSFGHLSFMAVGAYISGILSLSVSFKKLTLPHLPAFLAAMELDIYSSLPVALAGTCLLAWATGKMLSRLEGSAASIATLGLLVIVHGVIVAMREFTRGSQSFFGVPRQTTLWLCLIVGVLTILLARVFRDGIWGLQLRASRDDLTAAWTVGVDAGKRRLQAWILSAIPVAAAGVLLGHFLGTFSPKKFYFVDTFALLAMLIIGGMSSVSGAIFGTVLLTAVTEILRRTESGIMLFGYKTPEFFGTTQIGIGLAILLVMYFKPSGLFGMFEIDEILWRRRKKRDSAGGSDHTEKLLVKTGGELQGSGIIMDFSGLRALDRVSIKLEAGEVVGLIGPNGSGKTTMLNILSGTLQPTGGQIVVDGSDITATAVHMIAGHKIARTFQNIRLFGSLTVEENVEVAAVSSGMPATQATADFYRSLLNLMELGEEANRLATTLSYGGQRRVEIARALAVQPRYLLLDEPAAGMNAEESHQLLQRLRLIREKFNIGLLIVDHDMDVIMGLCDRILVLNEGRLIAEGSPDEIQRNPAVIEAYMGRKYAERMKDGETVAHRRI